MDPAHLAYVLIGAAKPAMIGLSRWRGSPEMAIRGIGEALITYGMGPLFGTMVG